MSVKIISVDAGWMNTKIFPGGTINSCLVLPTAVGSVAEHKSAVLPDFVFDGASRVDGSFSGGHYAIRYGQADSSRQDRQWYGSPEYLKTMYTACAAAGVQDGDRIILAMCLPIDDDEKAPILRNTLTGNTQQGIASFFHYYLSMSGKPKIDLSSTKIYIVEAGGNTLQEIMFDGETDIREGTLTHFDKGYWRIVRRMAEYLGQEYGLNLSLLEAAQAVHAGKVFADGEVDLSAKIAEEERALSAEHVRLISRHQERLKNFQVLRAAGGTGERFLPAYQTVNARFELMPNALYSNVVGTYKAARRAAEKGLL